MSNVYFTDIHGHKWLCTREQKEWLEAYEKEALRRGRAQKAAGKPVTYILYGLDIFQVIGGSVKSAGTHLEVDGKASCIDTAQISYDMVKLARDMGGDATWSRKKNWDGKGGMVHCHINLRGLTTKYSAYQYTSPKYGVDHGHNGLANGAKDDGPKPLSKRRWDEGISWAESLAHPAPPPPPVVIPDTPLSFGYGNLFGTYKPTDVDKARFRAQLGLIKTMAVSLFVALELHEENGSAGMLAYYKVEAAKQGLAVAEGKGGNHLLYDPKKYKILTSANKEVGGRWASRWNLQRLDTGIKFWVAALHTTAGTSPANVLARNKQVKNFLAWIANLERVLIAIDKNNVKDAVGTPTRQLRQAGRADLYDVVGVENSQFNSHHDRKDVGDHIDSVSGGKLIAFTGGKQIRTAALSDHDFIKADTIVKGMAA